MNDDQDIPQEPENDEDLIAEAKRRFEFCVEAEKDMRELALEDLKFRRGDQWPEPLKAARIQANKPWLTINVLPARERQILNDIRQNRPQVHVDPVGDGADEDTAEVMEGLVRHIQYDSHADVAIDTAVAFVVRTGGPGWMRLVTEYESPTSLKRVIKIKRVLNPHQVYCDPTCQEADYSDAQFVFYFEPMSKEEFRRDYPEAKLSQMPDWKGEADKDPEWLSEHGVRVCEYFYIDYEEDEVWLVQNPLGEQREMLRSEVGDKKLPRGVKILDRRDTQIPKVKWCKFTAYEVLDREDWDGQWLGWVPVLGDELYVDGKRTYEGMVRHVKDPMRMNNVMASEQVQAIGLAPKAPYVAATGQVEGHREWETANADNWHVLKYEPISAAGTLVPPPQRNVAEPPIQAISQARLQFVDDIKAITGIYDAQLGARSNEQSGRAINQRKQQGELSNFHIADNLARSLRFLGLQIIDLIPHVYSEAQIIRIIGEDGMQKQVPVNQKFRESEAPDAVEKLFDLTTGKYDVTVSTGPSYQTKRQEAVETMLEIRRGNPNIPPIYDDLLFQNMDFPGHEQMAERARRALPPNLLDDDGSDPELRANKLQSQLQTVMQQHALLTQALNQANDVIKGKKVENDARIQIAQQQELTRLEIVKLQEATKLAVAQINASKDANENFAQREAEQYALLHGDAHELAMQKDQQAHELAAADQAHQQSLEQTDQQGQITAAQSAQDAAQNTQESTT